MIRFISSRHSDSPANIIKLLTFIDEMNRRGELTNYENEIIKDVISQYDESAVVMLEYLLHRDYNNLKRYLNRVVRERSEDKVYINELLMHSINYLISQNLINPTKLGNIDDLIVESYPYIANMHHDFIVF